MRGIGYALTESSVFMVLASGLGFYLGRFGRTRATLSSERQMRQREEEAERMIAAREAEAHRFAKKREAQAERFAAEREAQAERLAAEREEEAKRLMADQEAARNRLARELAEMERLKADMHAIALEAAREASAQVEAALTSLSKLDQAESTIERTIETLRRKTSALED